jgi:uncharacterized protein with PQ loop repeat
MGKKELKKFTKKFDYATYLVGIVGPFFVLPEVIRIYTTQDVAGIAIISWASFLLFAFVWLGWGILHKSKPVIITNLLWIGSEGSIVLAYFLFI